jgi:peptidoglycan/xylan/chitin deacetylase (PgdA/CDA1 family)
MLKKIIAAVLLAAMLIAPAFSNTKKAVELPVFMYHFITENAHEYGELHVTPADFERDLAFLSENGYNTIDISDLIDFVYGGVPLPANPVMLTFDDGYYNNYYHAFPLLREYNAKAVIFPIVRHTDIWSCAETFYEDLNHGHMTWDNIREMLDSGLVEFGGHSYDMHKTGSRRGVRRKRGESLSAFRKLLEEDTLLFNGRFLDETGFTPESFAFPFHEVCEDAAEILFEHGYRVLFTHRGENSRNRVVFGEPESLRDLYRVNRSRGRGVSDVLN